eukprot:SAG11_NODE_693_length_7696_cov_5.410294_6_plen_133_part_00
MEKCLTKTALKLGGGVMATAKQGSRQSTSFQVIRPYPARHNLIVRFRLVSTSTERRISSQCQRGSERIGDTTSRCAVAGTTPAHPIGATFPQSAAGRLDRGAMIGIDCSRHAKQATLRVYSALAWPKLSQHS